MIIIDSNIWIFAEDDTAREHRMAARKVHEVVNSTSFGINPVIVSEVFHILSRLLGVVDSGRRVTNIIEHPVAQWLGFSVETAKGAISLAAQSKIRINDALIAQQALDVGAAILTDDVADFKRIKGLKVVPLRGDAT